MSKKADKRKALKDKKQQLTLSKTAKQFEQPVLSKTPISQSVDTAKVVPPDAPLVITEPQTLMTYTRDHEDCGGQWSWGLVRDWGEEVWQKTLHPFLNEYEKKKWGEIDSERTGKGRSRRSKHIYYRKNQLIKEARARLIEIEKDDFSDQIFRFRLSGKRRLYGFRVSRIFYLLWYDPDHKLYDSKN